MTTRAKKPERFRNVFGVHRGNNLSVFVLCFGLVGLTHMGCGTTEDISVESEISESPPELAERPRLEEAPPPPVPATPTPVFQLEGNSARVETLTIGPGFRPDPIRKTANLIAPTLNASILAPDCRGMTLPEPDFILNAQHTFAELHLTLASDTAMTLIIVGPERDIHCYDDREMQRIHVSSAFQEGRHRIWVAQHVDQGAAPNTTSTYTLAVSELDPPE